MSSRFVFTLSAILFLLSIVIFCVSIYRDKKVYKDIKEVEIHDTIIRTQIDTIYHDRIRYVTAYDTSIIVTRDTIKDTVHLVLPIQHKEFRDTFGRDSAKATVSILYHGFNPVIDTAIYTLDVIPSVVIKHNGWSQFVGIGVGMGYGVSKVGNNAYVGPEVGIHFVYGFGYHWDTKKQ